MQILFNLAEEGILKFAKVDDPLSASAMHGVIGIYGLLMPPIFAKEEHLLHVLGKTINDLPTSNSAKGIIYGGDGRLLGAAVVGTVATDSIAMSCLRSNVQRCN